MNYTTSCHCGAVAATITGDLPEAAMVCNCSICRRKGHVLHFVGAGDATITAPEGGLADYTFNRHMIHHHFCATCGCSPFGVGSDGQGNAMVAVNLRCVPECDLDALAIQAVDGASL
jgi:hypothetical protein